MIHLQLAHAEVREISRKIDVTGQEWVTLHVPQRFGALDRLLDMEAFAWIRFSTYAVLLAIALHRSHEIRLIPVDLVGEGELEEAAERVRVDEERAVSDARVVNQQGTEATKSGSELMSLVRAEALKNKRDLDTYERPYVVLMLNSQGRLVWFFGFAAKIGQFTFQVTIDDRSGDTTFADTTAPM